MCVRECGTLMLACKSAPLHIFVFRSRLCHISQRFLVAKAAQIHKSTSVRAKRCCKEQHRSLKRPGPKGQRRQSWQWPGPGRRKNLVMAALRGHPCGCTLVVVAWLRSKVCNIVSHTERPTSTSTGGARCRWAWVFWWMVKKHSHLLVYVPNKYEYPGTSTD